MLRHVVYALRSLLRDPLLTTMASLTMAVGLAAVTATFSIIDTTLLKPLPYPRSSDLYFLGTGTLDGSVSTGKVAPVELSRLNDARKSVAHAAFTARTETAIIDGAGIPTPTVAVSVSDEFFQVLGLPMALGRVFTPDEHKGKGPSVAVLAFDTWTNLFGSAPDIVGRSIRLTEGPVTVVGVAPPSLRTPADTALWTNSRLDRQSTVHRYDGYVRLHPGRTAEELRAELDVTMAALAVEYPAEERNRRYTSRSLLDHVVGDLRPVLGLLAIGSVVVLLLALVNVTNLLLVRGLYRSREVALRAALGASRGDLVRQQISEALVLTTIAVVVGSGIAFGSLRALLAMGSAILPRFETVSVDLPVVAFVGGISLVTALLVAAIPAWRISQADVRGTLNEGGRGITLGKSPRRLFATMIVAEIALAILLIGNVGVVSQSLSLLEETHPGFDSEGRLTAEVLLEPTKYRTADQLATWFRAVSERIGAIPGVESVASASSFPLGTERDTAWFLAVAGAAQDPNRQDSARVRRVSPGFFGTMGIALLNGREFNWQDLPTNPPIAIVNRSFAQKFLAGREPLSSQFAVGYPTVNPKVLINVVGVVDDAKYATLDGSAEPTFYFSQSQATYWRQTVIVRTQIADPTVIGGAVTSAIREADPEVPIVINTADRVVADSLRMQRIGVVLMMMFAGCALVMAAGGIYGVVAHTVGQRTAEVATRLALGATPQDVVLLIAKQGASLILVGGALGLFGVYAGGRLLRSQISYVAGTDLAMVSAAVAVVVVVAAGGVLLPAVRISRMHARESLRA
ncbi:MAG: ADOP family duplicated permease [Hyphomicrobium sp.]|jgi:putative ABC transport system permease protein